MPKNKNSGIEEIIKEVKSVQENKERLQEITVADYLSIVQEDNKIAQKAVDWLIEAIENYGWEEIPAGQRPISFDGYEIPYRPKILSMMGLVGFEPSFDRFYRSLLTRSKMIKVFVGPTGSGKTSFLNSLMWFFEGFNPRPRFMLKDCPIQENPLNILPRGELGDENSCRKRISKILGINIGNEDVCFSCRAKLKKFHTKAGVVEWWNFPVVSFRLSRRGGVGFGEYAPSDAKTQSLAHVIGRENIGVTANPNRGFNDPEAFNLRAGEAGKSNRGVFWNHEGFKEGADPRFHYVNIDLAEEGKLQLQGSPFPSVDIDDLVIVDCNFRGLKAFWNDGAQEAVHSRTIIIETPHITDARLEAEKYRKLIAKGVEEYYDFRELQKPHVGDLTLLMTALWSVASRLHECDEFSSLVWKALAYSQGKDRVKNPLNNSIVDIRKLRAKGRSSDDITKREGMFGIDGRDQLIALTMGIVTHKKCLTPLNALSHLEYEIRTRMGKTLEDVRKFKLLLTGKTDKVGEVVDEYKNLSILGYYNLVISRDIEAALFSASRSVVVDLFNKYVYEASLWLEQKRDKDGTGLVRREPDIKFLEKIEDAAGFGPLLDEVGIKWRTEIVQHKDNCAERGISFDYDNHPLLQKAVNNVFLESHRDDLFGFFESSPTSGKRADKKKKELFVKMMKDRGYCEECMREAVDYYSSLIVRPKRGLLDFSI